MAGSKTDYLENALLNGVLGGPQFTLPTTVYIALSTAAFSESATGAAMSEASGGSYARVAYTNNATNWPAASGGSKSNAVQITFPAASATWGTIRSFYICDAATAGNALYGADLAINRDVTSGDTAFFAVGSIVIAED